MTFCTSIHCMDGRIQEPIIKYLRANYNITFVDTITEPGPCKILAEQSDNSLINSIMRRIEISIDKHESRLIAISGHYDCAGNPSNENTQKGQIREAVIMLRKKYPHIKIIGLWIDAEWNVHPV